MAHFTVSVAEVWTRDYHVEADTPDAANAIVASIMCDGIEGDPDEPMYLREAEDWGDDLYLYMEATLDDEEG